MKKLIIATILGVVLAIGALVSIGAIGTVVYWAMSGEEVEAAPEIVLIPTAPPIPAPPVAEIEEVKETGPTPEQYAAWRARQAERRLQAEADHQEQVDQIDSCATNYRLLVSQAQRCSDLPTKQERRECRQR